MLQVTEIAQANVEKPDPGWMICAVVDTERLSASAIEIAPVLKSTTKVTDDVRVPEDVADTVPASDEAVSLVSAEALWEKVMYSLLPR